MSTLTNNLYAQWRIDGGAVLVLRDDDDSPPERLLQAVWQHQRLRRDELKTLDGKTVRVLHPGFGNPEGGPDFKEAFIQVGDDAPRSGDVEVDIRASGWRAHSHDRNPNFQNVMLHVVWDGDARLAAATAVKGVAGIRTDGGRLNAEPPILSLRHVLDAPIGELALWLENESAKPLPEGFRGRCSASLSDLSEAQLTELLREAAQVRLHAKATQFRARARHVGWEQALWEGLFRALGYKHNVWPMHCLAETRKRWCAGADSPLELQARLLGLSGLLPTEWQGAAAGGHYLRQVWDHWWRERNEFEDCVLPRKVWRFHGQRPANHPQRRLALAAHWLAAGNLPARLQRWCTTGYGDSALLVSLVEALKVARDDFWSWHWTVRSNRLSKPQPLLGEKRVTDLAVNVILPWLSARAGEGGPKELEAVIEHRYMAWSAAQDNAVLRLARQRLLTTASSGSFRRAATQQGLMQVVRDFCDNSNAICENCRFPELLKTRFC